LCAFPSQRDNPTVFARIDVIRRLNYIQVGRYKANNNTRTSLVSKLKAVLQTLVLEGDHLLPNIEIVVVLNDFKSESIVLKSTDRFLARPERFCCGILRKTARIIAARKPYHFGRGGGGRVQSFLPFRLVGYVRERRGIVQ